MSERVKFDGEKLWVDTSKFDGKWVLFETHEGKVYVDGAEERNSE